MLTRDDVESYLLRTGLDHEEIGEGMWLVAGGSAGIVIHLSPPLLVFRMKVMDLPGDEPRCGQLFRRLLELNATDLIHAAYGLEEGDVILTESLEVENLDFNEFQATIDSFQMALASHMDALAEYRDCAPAQA
ncbi:MAG TPA: YbjN domain-containing protein [Longimicrobium sp.]|nr:YbjN domain-containing protein [Longimicrobium sp.]